MTPIVNPSADPITLRNDAIELAVASLGGQITSLKSRRTGREWLWRNPHLTKRNPPERPSGFGEYDTGGWDEIFPTVNPCIVSNTPWDPRGLVDHGELWFRRWRQIAASVDGTSRFVLSQAVDESGLPFTFERTLALDPDYGPLRIEYALANRSAKPLPFIWAAHPLVAIEPGMAILLPPGLRVTTSASVGLDLPTGTTFTWPKLPLSDGHTIDFSRVPPRDAGYAAKLFTSPLPEGRFDVICAAHDEKLQISFDAADVPHLALWLNFGAWTGAATAPYFNCGIEPTTSASDNLRLSNDTEQVQELASGETRRWRLMITLAADGLSVAGQRAN